MKNLLCDYVINLLTFSSSREGFVQELYPEAVVAPSPTVPVPSPLALNMVVLPKNSVLTKTRANNLLRARHAAIN
jgi:hypothetical protein